MDWQWKCLPFNCHMAHSREQHCGVEANELAEIPNTADVFVSRGAPIEERTHTYDANRSACPLG